MQVRGYVLSVHILGLAPAAPAQAIEFGPRARIGEVRSGDAKLTVEDQTLQKIRVTGRKLTDKIYYHHTGYIGGIKSIALEKLLAEHPERAIEIAVKGMLPKNPLGRAMFRKLHVFAGGEHPHQAQQPKPLEIQ